MVAFPILDAVLRAITDRTVFPSSGWVQHLTLWMGLFGGILAAAQGRHLSIAVGEALRSKKVKVRLDLVSRGGAIGILLCLMAGSLELVGIEREFNPELVGGLLPVWIAQSALPIGFLLMAGATFWRRGEKWLHRLLILGIAALVGPLVPLLFTLLPLGYGTGTNLLGLVVIVLLAAAGMPLYAVLGGAALFFFYIGGNPTVGVAAKAYELQTKIFLPSIPLFALAGVILARGGAPNRLIRLVRAWAGWFPGGSAIATILACAFFTAVTGASGVTILALGGLLMPVLLAAHYKQKFSLGLLTASGSVGLLFPPSLPVIFYAVFGRVPPDRLFYAAFLPGILLLVILAGFCLLRGGERGQDLPSFELKEALAALKGAWGDLLLPVIIIVFWFGFGMMIVEVAALAAFWAILLEGVIHRELGLRKGFPAAFFEAAVVVGALIVVISLALGLTYYLVDAQIPDRMAVWVTEFIDSRLVFLLALNLLLLGVGALMDIYSAIVIVLPIIIPIATMGYGISATHLGVIFLANLELGYLTPPVGLNLFLSSMTFDKPLLEVWRSTLPFLALVAVWVLLVTYVPWLSVGFADMILGPEVVIPG
jgi:tripartite ATP-independent transporter DctM subunit